MKWKDCRHKSRYIYHSNFQTYLSPFFYKAYTERDPVNRLILNTKFTMKRKGQDDVV